MHPSRRKNIYKLRALGYFNGQNKLQHIHHVIDSVKSQTYTEESKIKLKWAIINMTQNKFSMAIKTSNMISKLFLLI